MDAVSACERVYDLLAQDEEGTPVENLTDVVRVYNGEPRAGNLATPVAVTVMWSGMDAYTIEVTVRVYVKPDVDVLDRQVLLAQTVEQVERLLDDAQTMEFVRGTWTADYLDAIDALVAACPMTCSRTDF